MSDLAALLDRVRAMPAAPRLKMKVGNLFIGEFIRRTPDMVEQACGTVYGLTFETHWAMPPYGWALVNEDTGEVLNVGTIRPDAAKETTP